MYNNRINEALDPKMDLKEYGKNIENNVKKLGNVKKSLQGLMAIVNIGALASKGLSAFGGETGAPQGGGGGGSPDAGDVGGGHGYADISDKKLTNSYYDALAHGKKPSPEALTQIAKIKLANDYGIAPADMDNIKVSEIGGIPTKVTMDGKEFDLTKHLDKYDADKINAAKKFGRNMHNDMGADVKANPHGVDVTDNESPFEDNVTKALQDNDINVKGYDQMTDELVHGKGQIDTDKLEKLILKYKTMYDKDQWSLGSSSKDAITRAALADYYKLGDPKVLGGFANGGTVGEGKAQEYLNMAKNKVSEILDKKYHVGNGEASNIYYNSAIKKMQQAHNEK